MINSKYSVGNYAYFLGKIKRIEGVTERLRPDCGYFHIEGVKNPQKGIHISPINTTEDLLLKCGFTKHVTIGGYFFYHECGFRIDLIMGDFKILNYDKCKVDYLHQVQNTMNVLFQKELILNL